MRVALVNPNTSRETTAMMVAIARGVAKEGLVVEGLTAPRGVPLITEPSAYAVAAEVVASMAPDLREFDGVIVAAFGDPGADALRVELGCPVVGLAEAALAEAAAHGPYAIATTTPDLGEVLTALPARYGVPAPLAIRYTRSCARVLGADAKALVAELGEAAERAVADGARAVVIGGGPLADAAEAVARSLAVPVIAPVRSAVRAIVKRCERAAR
ncbi:aspartate/glutamate racemase family protein [Acuticoccus sp.]|uniref:aspartate/glutamate racemase family protein n=1 Tax=Acuticoccus sp. TaxID=1904378 RepID=UPI003B523A24